MNYIFGTHVGTQFRGTSIQSSSLKVFKEKIRRLIKPACCRPCLEKVITAMFNDLEQLGSLDFSLGIT